MLRAHTRIESSPRGHHRCIIARDMTMGVGANLPRPAAGHLDISIANDLGIHLGKPPANAGVKADM